MEEKLDNWRAQAKELGIKLFHRKKEDVLKEIEAREEAVWVAEAKIATEKAEVERAEREKRIAAELEAGEAAEKAKTQADARAKAEADAIESHRKKPLEEVVEIYPDTIDIAKIHPIAEHEEYEVGNLTPVEDLMARIKTLETTVNLIIKRIDRLVDAISKSKKTKGI